MSSIGGVDIFWNSPILVIEEGGHSKVLYALLALVSSLFPELVNGIDKFCPQEGQQ